MSAFTWPAIQVRNSRLTACQHIDAVKAMIGLDWAEVRRSRWLYVFLGINAVLAASFVSIGMRESALLGFTGMGRVMLSVVHALLLLLPLLALMLSGQIIVRSRDDGSLELLFSHPLSRSAYFSGISAVRYAALLIPLLALMMLMAGSAWAIFGEPVPWASLLRESAVCAGLLWAFTGLGFAISASVRSQTRALICLLLAWLAGVALLDFALIGMMLAWGLNPPAVFLLAALNPVEAARMALLSAADPTLANLGPVGFYLIHQIGASRLFALGTGWPVLFGTCAWVYARCQFLKKDLV